MAEKTQTYEASVTKNSSDNTEQRARAMFNRTVDVGTAIVNILGNTGIAGFKFHIDQTEQVNMESEITDHYTDTNSPVQDHIARRPVTITVQGYQGEYFYSVHPIKSFLATVVPTLALVKQFMPKLPNSTKQKLAKKYQELTGKNETPKALQASKDNYNGMDLYKLFQDIYKLKSAQTRAFLFFEAMWQSEAPFTVETSWRRYDNMVIQKITPMRDNNADITDFSITFKQIRKTTSLVQSAAEYAAGRVRAQKAEITDKGIDKGKETPTIQS